MGLECAVVKKLEEEGLTRKQAIGVMEALEDVVQESIRSMTSNLVTRAEQDKVRQSLKSKLLHLFLRSSHRVCTRKK